jgi:hypothetical protein
VLYEPTRVSSRFKLALIIEYFLVPSQYRQMGSLDPLRVRRSTGSNRDIHSDWGGRYLHDDYTLFLLVIPSVTIQKSTPATCTMKPWVHMYPFWRQFKNTLGPGLCRLGLRLNSFGPHSLLYRYRPGMTMYKSSDRMSKSSPMDSSNAELETVANEARFKVSANPDLTLSRHVSTSFRL